jgi:hypothetical protein
VGIARGFFMCAIALWAISEIRTNMSFLSLRDAPDLAMIFLSRCLPPQENWEVGATPTLPPQR